MADPVQNSAPAPVAGVEWDAPTDVQTGSPVPAPAPSTGGPAPVEGVEWETPGDSESPTLRQQLQTNTEPLSTNTGHPLTNISNFGQDVLRRGARVLGTGLLDTFSPEHDSRPVTQQLADTMHQSTDYAAPMHSLVTRLHEFGQDYQKDPGTAVANAVGDVGATAATGQMVKGIHGAGESAIERVNAPVDPATTTPRRALAGLIAKAPGMGDNFEPEAVAESVEPLIRQAAKADPETAKLASDSKDPKVAYKAFQKLANNAQVAIDTAHRQVLSKVSNTPVSVRPVLEAMDASMPQGLESFAPKDAAAVRDLRANIANAKTLGDLNGLRVYLNTELSPEFKMDNVAVGRSGSLDKAMRSALSATKDAYYDNLQHVTGQDFRSLKMMESNLMTYQEALANSRRGQFAAQAEFNRPTTTKQKVATVGEMAGAVMHGDKGKIARTILREAPMEQTHANIRQVLKGVPKNGSGFDVDTEPDVQPRQLGTGSGIEEGDDTYQHEKGAPARPAVVTPFQNRPLLPETAGQGLVTEPAAQQPHPGVNEPTATTRVRQPIFKKPEPTPARTITVSPEGTATIQRPALPAPPAKIKTLKTRKILSGS
jgi:hypothetical protein